MKIVICDVQQDVREHVRAIVERSGLEVVGEASCSEEAMDLTTELVPDVVVMEVSTKNLTSSEFARRLSQAGRYTKVVGMSPFEEEASVLELFRSGVRAYVLKHNVDTDLLPALRNISRGKRFLSPGTLRRVVAPYPSCTVEKPATLSALETELLRLLALDVPKNDISVKLSISVEAIEELRKKIMETLNAINNGALVRYSIRNGLQRN